MVKCARCKNDLKRKEIVYNISKDKILLSKGKNIPFLSKTIDQKYFCEVCYKMITNFDKYAEIKDIVYTVKDLLKDWIFLSCLLASVIPLAYIFNDMLAPAIPLFLSVLVLFDIRKIENYLREHAETEKKIL